MASKGNSSIPLFEKLTEEHTLVEELFEQMESGNMNERRGVFAKLYEQLTAHAKAEEAKLYPELKRHDQTRELAEEALEEHKEVEELLEELANTSTSDPEWKEAADELRTMVSAHVEREENEIFQLAARVLDLQKLEQLEREYSEEEGKQLRRLLRREQPTAE
jgi:hemerythrin superfamily protein